MKLAIIGIQGIPNSYGGFETLAENLVEHLSQDIQIEVYCSSKDMKEKYETYKGAKLKYIPITSHGPLGMLYDCFSLIRTIKKSDKVLILGFGPAFIMPFMKKYKSKIVLNMGGLDWKRSKWSKAAQKVIRLSERLLVKYSGTIISDNLGIQRYLFNEYHTQTILIPYGGDQAASQLITDELSRKYKFLNDKYAFSVCRIQPDNNIEMILNAFQDKSALPLVMVGNWQMSRYGKEMRLKYQNRKNLVLLEAIYDRKLLDVLRSNCTIYIHGHSAGGTNPSLVEAMYLGLPVFSFASGYNEHTTQNLALYFEDEYELSAMIEKCDSLDIVNIGKNLKEIAEQSYRWKNVICQYKRAFSCL